MRTGVVIALYNGMHYLREQIDSLLAQTTPPDTIVCCDDGSTDGCFEWLSSYVNECGASDRFILIKNSCRLGYVQNFYKALDVCDADIVFLCDQDDIWKENKLETMVAPFLANKNLSLLSCAHSLIDSSGASISSMRYAQKEGSGEIRLLTPEEVITHFNWPGMTMALRKTFWNSIRTKAKVINAPHDRVLALMAASVNAMGYLDISLCYHRFHTSNSGGEENNLKTYLDRAFKIKELSTSITWLESQIANSASFSSDAQAALNGYNRYLKIRLQALTNRNPFILFSVLKQFKYINLKGIAADLFSIFFSK